MGDAYARRILRNSVAQICQTIGYHSTQNTPHEVLEDVLHRFLQEFCRDLRRHTEHYNRIEANINDVQLTLKNLNISVPELRDYINNVEPVPYPYEIPKFPIYKEFNLNFLKPGSKEVLTRPVHIYDYLPPILPPSPDPNDTKTTSKETETNAPEVVSTEDAPSSSNNIVEESTENAFSKGKNPFSLSALGICSYPKKRTVEQAWTPIGIEGPTKEDTVRDVRELTSVFMTTGGFISPAVEGKVASSSIPEIIEKAEDSNSLTPAQLSSLSGDTDLTQVDSGKNNLDKEIALGPSDKTEHLGGSGDDWAGNTNPKKDNSSLDITSPTKKHSSSLSQTNVNPSQPATVASKLLKKAKKKNLNPSLAASPGKFPKSDQFSPNNLNTTGSTGATMDDLCDKIQRKWIKKLQKLSKSKQIGNLADLFGADGKFKGVLGPGLLASLPPGPERQQLEKLLRKQAKQKQKLMKQQLGKEGKMKRSEQQQLFAPDNVTSKKMAQPIPGQMGYEMGGMGSGINAKDSKLTATSKHGDMGPLPISPSSFPFKDSIHSHMIDSVQAKHAEEHPIGDYKHNLTDLPTKNNQLEVKLSTEPNRSKLNIFKKISKQKNLKSPSNSKLVPGTTIFDSNDVAPVINLPSGTTITPAPPTSSGHHVYSPDIQQENAGDIQSKTNLNLSEPSSLLPNAGSILTVFNTVPPYEGDISLVNKPKKRGRKPGQKNNPKPAGLADSTPAKKAKKMKGQHQNMYMPPDGVGVPSSISVEPLNLYNTDFDGNRFDLTSQFGTGGIPKSMVPKESLMFPVPGNERKERKKSKNKNLVTNMPMDANSQKSIPGVPTKEEVNLINEKLLRMDTTMKPTVPTSQIGDFSKMSNDSSSSKSASVSPVKSMSPPKIPGSKKKAQSKLHGAPILPSPFIPQVPVGFPNLQGNMQMMQMYPFQPRPGLIPAPGLFPTPGLGNFVNNPSNPASNMLLSRFMQLPNLKSAGSSGSSKDTAESDKLPAVPPPVGDRSYCNVAPLVPDFMKLIPLDMMSPTKSKREDRDGQKQFKSKQYPVFGEVQVEDSPPRKQDEGNNKKRLIGDGKSWNSMNKNSTMSASESGNFNESFDDKNISFGNPVYGAGLSKTGPMPRMPSQMSGELGGADAPIELSDDSVDMSLEMAQTTSPSKSKSKNSMNKSSSTMSESEPLGDENLYGKVKKMKKSNKSSKKHNPVEGDEEPGLFDMFASEKGSKLSGGAKLIPIPVTNRLVDMRTNPGTSMSKKDGHIEKSSTEFESITITSSSAGTSADLQKKRKEHKKLKKTKEGKIKKKKDKKDKTKSKERSEKHLLKAEKILKDKDLEKYKEVDFIKKLKKEKKREKQRMSIDSSTFNIVNKPSFSPNSVVATSTITATADSTVSFGNFSATSTTSVPKLTLKLGERDKKELSPELARISPLITRPPKQKPTTDPLTTYGSSQPTSSSSSCSGQGSGELLGEGKSTPGLSSSSAHGKNMPTSSPWFAGGTIAASSVLLPQQLIQPSKIKESYVATSSGSSTAPATLTDDKASTSKVTTDKQNASLIPEANRPSSYIDAEGNRVWICPACGKVDDGSAMIGCDGCDAWYHWVCVGIFIAPKDNEDWFCRVCITRKKGAQGSEKKRKRTKKK